MLFLFLLFVFLLLFLFVLLFSFVLLFFACVILLWLLFLFALLLILFVCCCFCYDFVCIVCAVLLLWFLLFLFVLFLLWVLLFFVCVVLVCLCCCCCCGSEGAKPSVHHDSSSTSHIRPNPCTFHNTHREFGGRVLPTMDTPPPSVLTANTKLGSDQNTCSDHNFGCLVGPSIKKGWSLTSTTPILLDMHGVPYIGLSCMEMFPVTNWG